MQNNDTSKVDQGWEKLLTDQPRLDEQLCPPVSIIIPTFNNAQNISITIESILSQRYPDFEVLLIDAGSTDRTLEIVKGFHDERIRLCSVTGYNRYEMLNKGIVLSTGLYINFLFPGDYYIHRETLMEMMVLAHQKGDPELLYCGCLLRESGREAKILFRPLSIDLLKHGQQPTSLQSCWFKSVLFDRIGKFSPALQSRGGYDLMCRFMLDGEHSFVSLNRVLTDYDLRGVTRKMVIQHFMETWKIIVERFGLLTACIWICKQNEFSRYMHLTFKSLKSALFGRS